MVGLGALGTVAATQLGRAGVGYMRLIDRDIVEASNLQRQVLFDESDAALHLPKALAAAEKLRAASSGVAVEERIADLTPRNAEALLGDVDLIVDGTDNFQTRHLVNDVAVKHRIPWVYGGAVSSYGTTALLRPGKTPCLVCLFGALTPAAPETCDTVGVIAPVVGVIASLQVAEALKYLAGREDALRDGITYVDVWANQWRTVRFPPRSAQCPCCGLGRFDALAARSDALTISFCGRNTVQVRPDGEREVSFADLASRLARVGSVRLGRETLRIEVDKAQITLFRDGRALVHGVDDPAAARSLYARYIGM